VILAALVVGILIGFAAGVSAMGAADVVMDELGRAGHPVDDDEAKVWRTTARGG